MRKLRGFGVVLVSVLFVQQTTAQPLEPTFDLGFRECRNYGGIPGAAFAAEVIATLSTRSNPSATDGAHGWSISLSSEGVQITAVTTADTAGAPAPVGFQTGGFEKTELTATGPNPASCPGGRDGAVSAIVLSFTLPTTLPPADNTQDILRVTLEGTYPEETECDTARVFFVDGCRGSGQPVGNRVAWTGNTVIPSLGECSIDLCAVSFEARCPSPNYDLQVIIQSENTNHVPGPPFATGSPPGLAPTPDPFQPAQVIAPAGSTTVYAAIVSQLAREGLGGVQGWSLSLIVTGDIELSGVSTAGTAAAPAPVGLQNGGFEKTEIVNPAIDSPAGSPQGTGAVTAVVLSFTLPITLAADSTASILGITVFGESDASGQICWRDGMRGSGQPVRNVATVNGETRRFGCCQSADVLFLIVEPSLFIRCDSNNDSKNDIADAIWIVNELFRSGPATACPAAADCDADGQESLTDALYCVNYQFRGGSAPPQPFPDCGTDEVIVTELCPGGSTLCP